MSSCIVLLGLLLRVLSMHEPLWLDEAWSYLIARNADSPLDIIFHAKYDNNHVLNTLYLYLIPPDKPWFVYRLHSVFFGTGTIILSGIASKRFGNNVSLITMLLFATSLIMIRFSVEARGYSALTFFTLLSFILSEKWYNKQTWQRRLLFTLVCLLGILSHATFVIVPACLCILAARNTSASELRRLAAWFLVPGILVCLAYISINMGMSKWEQPSWKYIQELQFTASDAVGDNRTHMYQSAFVLLLSSYIGIRSLHDFYRNDRQLLLFFIALGLCSLVFVIVGMQNQVWAMRFVLVPIVYCFLVLGTFLSSLGTKHTSFKAVQYVLVAGFIFVNVTGVHDLNMKQHSRVYDAMELIHNESPNEEILIGSNAITVPMESKIGTMRLPNISYSFFNIDPHESYNSPHQWYKEFIDNGERRVPHWYITVDLEAAVDEKITVEDTEFSLYKTYPLYSTYGAHQHLYKRVEDE